MFSSMDYLISGEYPDNLGAQYPNSVATFFLSPFSLILLGCSGIFAVNSGKQRLNRTSKRCKNKQFPIHYWIMRNFRKPQSIHGMNYLLFLKKRVPSFDRLAAKSIASRLLHAPPIRLTGRPIQPQLVGLADRQNGLCQLPRKILPANEICWETHTNVTQKHK